MLEKFQSIQMKSRIQGENQKQRKRKRRSERLGRGRRDRGGGGGGGGGGKERRKGKKSEGKGKGKQTSIQDPGKVHVGSIHFVPGAIKKLENDGVDFFKSKIMVN